MKYNCIRPLAFQPVSPESIQTPTFYKLCFPNRWYKELSMLWKSLPKHQNKTNVNLPTKSLNSTLQAIVPDLISVQYPAEYNRFSWLYSNQPIDKSHLIHIVKAWARVSLKDVPEGGLHEVIQSFDSKEVQWQSCQWSGSWGQCSNGTAEPVGEFYTVLPYYLAAQLTNVPFEVGDEVLRFKRYPLSVGTGGAELMSWPPKWHQGSRGASGYFSLYFRLSIQTVPFHEQPLLYIHTGTRRFVDPTVTFTRDIKSAVLYTQIPWLEGLQYENSFQIADVRTRKVSGEEENKGYELRWDDDLVDIIQRLNIGNPLPLAKDLLGQHENFIFGNTQALLLHNTSVGSHPVAVGISPADRSAIFAELREKLSGSWQAVEDYVRVSHKVSARLKNPFDRGNSKATSTQRIERLKVAVGPVLQLLICYIKSETPNAILEELTEQLGHPCKEGMNYIPLSEGGEFKVNVRCVAVNEIGEPLNYEPGPRPSNAKKQQAYRAAVHQRMQQIAGLFHACGVEDKAHAVLFELPGREEFTRYGENRDPKEAIRQGLARQGYLTQFVSSSETGKTLKHRISRALLDLYRQLGVLPYKPEFLVKNAVLPDRLNIIGVWIIRFNNDFGWQTELPIAVHLRSDLDRVMVKLPKQNWLPYDLAQLTLAKEALQDLRMDNTQRKRFIQEWLLDLLDHLPEETLLLMDAQNIRQVWPDIQNGKLVKDKLTLTNMLHKPIGEISGLRLVRLREDQSNEVPQIFTFDADSGSESEVGLTQGVYMMADRVFASIGAKPKTAQVTAKSSKFGSYETRSGTFEAAPGYSGWNPRVCELTVYGLLNGDDPAIWASVVHELRKMSLQFDDTTILPLPLHLANRLQEYVGV